MPVAGSIIATDRLLLLQLPIPGSDIVAVVPAHKPEGPVIESGSAFTVTTEDVWQPPGAVYVIVDVPGTKPVTIPVPEIVASAELLLVHVPPVVASLNGVEAPAQILSDPEIGVGDGFTVAITVVKQLVGKMYVINAVPGVTPLTTPAPVPTVATERLPLAHVPVPKSLKDVVAPAHMEAVPDIDEGNGLTVIITARVQPVDAVKVIVDVPDIIPPTIPVPDPTVAVEVALLLQVPGVLASLNVVVSPAQTLEEPLISAGRGLTLTVVVVEQSPLPNEYVIGTEPDDTPPTIPEIDPTVAIAVLLLAQRPPVVASPNVAADPTQTFAAPVIATGLGYTVRFITSV